MQNVIFLHIPKAAGNTIRAVAQRHFRASEIFAVPRNVASGINAFKQLPEQQRARFRFLIGHMMYGLHQWLHGESTYMTFLRDPVERTLSFWKYIKSNPAHPMNSVIDAKWSLSDFLRSKKTSQIENLQTVCLSGKALTSFECSKDEFEKACENLRMSFSAVGLVERFDESIALCCSVFGWQDARWFPLNTSKLKMHSSELTEEEYSLIIELNQWDVKLYEFARKIQHEQVTNNQVEVNQFLRQLQMYKPSKLETIVVRITDSLLNRIVLWRSTRACKQLMSP